MSWLFRRKPVPPPPNTVVIAEDVAASLLTAGAPLETAVNDALREHIEAKAREATDAEAHGIPFWLRRDSEHGGDIEEQLRDRVIQRRSSEEGSG